MEKSSQVGQTDRQDPVIIIGAGRSGSTMLSAILNAHPDISFFGETYFLAPFVWNRVFEEHGLIVSYLNEWRNKIQKEKNDFVVDERKRIGKLVAQFVADVVQTDNQTINWGFKEIWNGSPQFETFSWDIYDEIFPNAKYIHLVRNPFRYAISTAGREQGEFTREMLDRQLSYWVAIHEYNKKRIETGRYCFLRYEDILDCPEKNVKMVCDFIGINWKEQCLAAMKKKWVPSLRDPLEGRNILNKSFKVNGLYQYVKELGYSDDIDSMGIALKDDRKKNSFGNNVLSFSIKSVIKKMGL